MNQTQTQLTTNTWVTATWQEYVQTIQDRTYEKAKSYYHKGKLRIEMSPLGNDHANDHGYDPGHHYGYGHGHDHGHAAP